VRSARRQPVACGVDIGTINTKVAAVTSDGMVVSRAVRSTPRDAQDLWIDVLTLSDGIDQMFAEVCGEGYEIHAICAAGIGEDGEWRPPGWCAKGPVRASA